MYNIMNVFFGVIGSVLPTPVVVTAVLLIVFKLYLVVTCGVCKSKRKLTGKTVIITGSNKGIGKQTALDLAARGARVILACRDVKRANAAREEIIASTMNESVIVHKLDLASFSSVREFAKTILETEERLDVLINCAGVAGVENVLTDDGLQIEVQTNYFGPFLLTNLLVDLMKKSAPSRIIFVSSITHLHGTIDAKHFNFVPTKGEKVVDRYLRYAFTKLANVLNSNELARRLQGTGVTANSVHPGAVATDVFANVPFGLYPFIRFYLEYFCKSSAQGAQTGIYLAVSEEVEGVTGKYFVDCKEASMGSSACDEELAKRLWVKTEDILNKSI